jgi:uncharacterized protein (TIRG00374 family)
VDSLEERLGKVERAFETVGQSKATLLRATVVAHMGFLFQVLCLYFILLSLGIRTDLTPLYFTITLSSFANFSPTPGGSGTFEFAMTALLSILAGVPSAAAFVAAVLFRVTTYWPGLGLGWAALNSLEAE